jgi:negative regulator of sigma E activity
MIFKYSQTRLSVLLLIMSLAFVATTRAQTTDLLVSEILQRLPIAENEVSYVGKELSMTWSRGVCRAREQLVVHQAASTHFIKQLVPAEKPEPGDRRRQRQRDDQRNPATPGPRPFHNRLSEKKTLDLLLKNYNVQIPASDDEIAGYETYLLTITPRFEGRPSKRIWVAKDKGIILRSEDLDSKGEIRSLSVYTQISFQTEEVQKKVSDLELPVNSPNDSGKLAETLSLSKAQRKFKRRLILPTILPHGFELEQVMLLENLPKPAVHLLYTDGLTSLSLFESKDTRFQEPPQARGPDRPRRDGERRGGPETKRIGGASVQIFELPERQVRIYRWRQDDLGLTLIGDLSPPEMVRTVGSIIRSVAK